MCFFFCHVYSDGFDRSNWFTWLSIWLVYVSCSACVSNAQVGLLGVGSVYTHGISLASWSGTVPVYSPLLLVLLQFTFSRDASFPLSRPPTTGWKSGILSPQKWTSQARFRRSVEIPYFSISLCRKSAYLSRLPGGETDCSSKSADSKRSCSSERHFLFSVFGT
ncbi:unnamed protein product [Hapterophycus canaliculatus]